MTIVDRDIKSVRDILSAMSVNKKLKQLAEMREKAIQDEISRINGASRQGREEGKKSFDSK